MRLVMLRSMFVCAVLMFSGLAFLLGGNVVLVGANSSAIQSNASRDGAIRLALPATYTADPAATTITVGNWNSGTSIFRGYLSFDISSIPLGAVVQSVSLSVTLYSSSFAMPDMGQTVGVYTSSYGTLDIADWNAYSNFQGIIMTRSSTTPNQAYSVSISTSTIAIGGAWAQYCLKSSLESGDYATWLVYSGDAPSYKPTLLIVYSVPGVLLSMQLNSGAWLNSTTYPEVSGWNLTYDLNYLAFDTVPNTKNVTIATNSTWTFQGVQPACAYVQGPTYLRLVNVYSSLTYRTWFTVPKSSPYSTVHIALYNAYTGEGFTWGQMRVRVCQGAIWNNTTAQNVYQPDVNLQPNANYSLRVLDYFGNILTSWHFLTSAQDIYVPVPVPVFSWQVFNENDQPVLMKIFWNNSGSPWEFFVGPHWQIERLLKGGNYTFETTFYGNNGTVGATVVYHRIIPMSGLNASFLFINGTTLSEIITDVQGMRSTQEIITSLLSPSTVIIYEQLPIAPIRVMSLTISTGLKLDPYMILQSTTYQNGTGATVNLWTPHPLLVGATYYVDSDTLSFSGNYNTHVWVNTTPAGPTPLLDSAILPATFNLLGQNVTVHGNKSLTVSRATTWREISTYTTNYYISQHKYSMTLKLNDSTSLVYYTPYWFIGFPHNATIDQSTVTVFDVNNHLTLTKGSNFEVTAGGIHLTLSRLNASQNRTFTFTFWDANGTTGMGAPNLIAAAYSASTLNGVPVQYSAVQWMNPWSATYSGEMYVTLNFTGGDQLVSASIVIVDQTTNRQLTTSDWVYTGRTIIILTSGVGTVPVGGGKNFGIYFTLGIPATPTKSDFFFGPIVYGSQQVYVAGYAISWALVTLIIGWVIVGLAYVKKSKQVPSYAVIMVSVSIILGFAMRALGGP